MPFSFDSSVLLQASTAHYSCPVSLSTVEVVEMCPDTEGKWKEAAAKKNCTAYASRCSEPARLVYHCVINTYANQTLEVCAYAQNILDGKIINWITEHFSIYTIIFFSYLFIL